MGHTRIYACGDYVRPNQGRRSLKQESPEFIPGERQGRNKIDTKVFIERMINPTIISCCLSANMLCSNELKKIFKKNYSLLIVIFCGVFLNIFLHNFNFSLDVIVNGFFLGTSSIGIAFLVEKIKN